MTGIKSLVTALAFGIASVSATAASAETSQTLETVKKAGAVKCGANGQLAGFSTVDSAGKWTGLDVDFCRAVAAAVLGDANKAELVPMTPQQRFPAIQSGEIQLLTHTVTATLTREASVGMLFAKPLFYDGQAFMVKKSLGVTSAKELDGASVCVKPGTVTEQNIADFARANGIKIEPVVIEQQQQVVEAFLNDRCVAFTDDSTALASVRSEQGTPDDFVILPEVLSKEPLSPGVRADDPRWFMIVNWVREGLIAAEELGVTQANVDEMKSSQDPAVQRLLGVSGDLGSLLGLGNDWMYNSIKSVGNYGDIYERNVGKTSPLKQERGLNEQWKKGGLMYANPLI
ncbi:amino acid ABC transporter substrate-binding protein [Rhizobium giardinii]|uniref:amino acid ABC transporter substrate-binding protein n=1 Tax=Rhizobium giardinii TaxID=56731 RepID=UPI000DD52DA0